MNYRESVIRNIANHVPESEYITMGAMGLCGEAGEVADLIKKHKFQGQELNKEKLIKELGDVRWYMEVLCYAIETTIEEIEQVNINKLMARYPNGFTAKNSTLKKDEK